MTPEQIEEETGLPHATVRSLVRRLPRVETESTPSPGCLKR